MARELKKEELIPIFDEMELPELPEAVTIDESEMQRLLGRYSSARIEVNVEIKDGQIAFSSSRVTDGMLFIRTQQSLIAIESQPKADDTPTEFEEP